MKYLKESTLEDLGIPLLDPRGEWEYARGETGRRGQAWDKTILLGGDAWMDGPWVGADFMAIYARRKPRPAIELPPYEGATERTKYGFRRNLPDGYEIKAQLNGGRWLSPFGTNYDLSDIVAYEAEEQG